MIIDKILDRKTDEWHVIENGKIKRVEYSAKQFYKEVMEYTTNYGVGVEIANALDSGTELDVKNALCDYIKKNEYSTEICEYINSVNWLIPDIKEIKK